MPLPEHLQKYKFAPGTQAGKAHGSKYRLMELWKAAREHAYDARYTDAEGKVRVWRINSPFDALLFMVTTRQDPCIGMMNAKLGAKSPFLSVDRRDELQERAEEKGINTDAARLRLNGFMSTEDWLNAIRLLQPYMLAKLQSIEVTGEDGAPLSASVDIVKTLSEIPGMRRMMEQVQAEATRIIEATPDEDGVRALSAPDPDRK